jgi:hypothetical protein
LSRDHAEREAILKKAFLEVGCGDQVSESAGQTGDLDDNCDTIFLLAGYLALLGDALGKASN